MTLRLKLIFALILVTIVCATSWASSILPFYKTPQPIVTHPWFIATLVDTYLAFFTYWLWVAYKETSNIARIIWLLLIFALGNMAMAAYALITLFRLPAGASIEDFLLRRPRKA
jgi:hypothetical protein